MVSIERQGQINKLIAQERSYDSSFMVGYGMTAMDKLLFVLGLDHIKKSAKQRDLSMKNTRKDNLYKDLFSRISACSELSSKRDSYLADPGVKREIASVTVNSDSEEVRVGSIEDLYSSIHPSGKKRSATGKKRKFKSGKIDQDDKSGVEFLISWNGTTAKP